MAKKPTQKLKRITLSKKFMQSLFTLFLVLSLLLIPIVYFITKAQVMDQANKELTLLVDMVKSIRNVVREDTRPHFMPRGEFFPPVVSSTVMAKTVAAKFARLQPDYYIKMFSDNPLNAEDLPDQLEVELLRRFRENRELKSIVETGTINSKPYLLSSAPSTVKKGCLFCHGKAEEAPFAIRNKYGVNSGYNWKIGTVIGGSAVGVPLANIYDVAFKRTLYALLALATIFGLIFLIINRMVSKNIIKPLLTISKQAQKISKGDMSKPILIESNDEIGDLGKSFELMRRSYISIIKRFRS